MSSVRIAVEHGFGQAQNKWSSCAWHLRQQIGNTAVGAAYSVTILLTNCLTCLQASQVSDQFLVTPPSLEEYLSAAGINLPIFFTLHPLNHSNNT